MTHAQVLAERMAQVEALALSSGSHTDFERGMCVMEAVSYVAGEPWSDAPQCACPVITAFMVSWNDSLPRMSTLLNATHLIEANIRAHQSPHMVCVAHEKTIRDLVARLNEFETGGTYIQLRVPLGNASLLVETDVWDGVLIAHKVLLNGQWVEAAEFGEDQCQRWAEYLKELGAMEQAA